MCEGWIRDMVVRADAGNQCRLKSNPGWVAWPVACVGVVAGIGTRPRVNARVGRGHNGNAIPRLKRKGRDCSRPIQSRVEVDYNGAFRFATMASIAFNASAKSVKCVGLPPRSIS